MMPLIFLIMIGYFIAIFGVATPESSLVTITSYIPFFSPMLMLLRVGMVDVPIWEVIVSIGILVGSIVRSEEHTSELQSRGHLVCRLLLKKKKIDNEQHRKIR